MQRIHRTTLGNNSFEQLEPCGAKIELPDLLRWSLTAAYVPLENRRSSTMAGGRRSTLRGRGIDFDEVRPYQAGDDVRAIDWRVTARADQPHTKVFREEKERPVLLLIDLRSHLFFGSRRTFKSVLVAHTAALLSWAALNAGDRIGALIMADDGLTEIKPRRNRHALLHIFRKIVTIQNTPKHQLRNTGTEPPPRLLDALRQLRVVVRPGSCLILISDFSDWDTGCAQAMYPIVRHSQCFALQVCDALDNTLPDIGSITLRFGIQILALDTAERGLISRFEQQQNQHQAQLYADWKHLNCAHLQLDTGADMLPAVRAFFGGRTQSKELSRAV